MRKSVIFGAAAAVLFIIFAIIFIPKGYDRIDVIDDSIQFRLSALFEKPNKETVGRAYVHSKNYNLAINNTPDNITMLCNNRRSFTADIINMNDYPVMGIVFAAENNQNLRFEFPEGFILPPLSSRKMTFFIDADCTDALQKVYPSISIKGTDLQFNIDISVEDRKE